MTFLNKNEVWFTLYGDMENTNLKNLYVSSRDVVRVSERKLTVGIGCVTESVFRDLPVY